MILGCDSKEGARLPNRGGAVRVSLSMGALDIFLLPLNLEVLRGTFCAASLPTLLLKGKFLIKLTRDESASRSSHAAWRIAKR